MPALLVAPDPADTATAPFDALYRRHAGDVFAYVMSVLHDRGAAEDATMAAFERAYRSRRRFDRRRGSERAWLFAIARNAALDELRRRRRSAALLTDPAGPAPAGDDGGRDPLERAAVRAALDALDPRDRELVALKFAAGLSNAEIAEVIGTTATNAGTRLYRVVAKLREACRA